MARMTIRDIARLAGVSVTTVSRALNNAPEINSQTRERVLQVCPGTGLPLQPAGSEPSLQPDPRAGRHSAELSGPFHASIVLHLERYAQEQDYRSCCAAAG